MLPSTLILTILYTLVAVTYFYKCILDGYGTGVVKQCWQLIIHYFGYVILAVIVLFVLFTWVDLPIALLMKRMFNQTIYTTLDTIANTAEGWCIGGIILTIALISELLNKRQLAHLAKCSLISMLYAGILNTLLKVLINRERPAILLKPWKFFHFFLTGSKHFSDLIYASNSMPSGHTITACAAMMPFILATKKCWLKLLLAAYIVLVCLARIYTLNHWISDVYIALLLGTLISYSQSLAAIRCCNS